MATELFVLTGTVFEVLIIVTVDKPVEAVVLLASTDELATVEGLTEANNDFVVFTANTADGGDEIFAVPPKIEDCIELVVVTKVVLVDGNPKIDDEATAETVGVVVFAVVTGGVENKDNCEVAVAFVTTELCGVPKRDVEVLSVLNFDVNKFCGVVVERVVLENMIGLVVAADEAESPSTF